MSANTNTWYVFVNNAKLCNLLCGAELGIRKSTWNICVFLVDFAMDLESDTESMKPKFYIK